MRTFHFAAALAMGLCVAACNGPSKSGDAASSGAPQASETAPMPAPGAPPSQGGAAGKGISQADADALCAQLNKNGAMASCELKDGQVVVQPKQGN